jgi:hypothetical protein
MSEDNSGDKKRRDVLKALPVATVGIPMVSGVGAAMPDTSETSDERITREEKARQAGYDWDEDWIDQDMIGKSSVETTETFSTDGKTNCLDAIAVLSGIKVGFKACFSPCDGSIKVTALDQTIRRSVTCSEACESISINAGAATLDLQLCLDWDNRCLEYEGEGCVWAVSSWNCETVDTSVCI